MAYAQPAAPKSGDSFSLKEHPDWVGALALVFPIKVNAEQQWDPAYPASETVTVDLALIDRIDPATGQPVQLNDSMVFGKVMVAQLKENLRLGQTEVLGRIGSKPTPKGPAWVFGDFVAGVDDAAADQYKLSHPRPWTAKAAQPGAAAGAAAPAAWQNAGAPAAPPAPVPPPQAPWQPPAAAAPAAVPWPAGLREFLQSKGITDAQLATMDEGTARNIASTYQ